MNRPAPGAHVPPWTSQRERSQLWVLRLMRWIALTAGRRAAPKGEYRLGWQDVTAARCTFTLDELRYQYPMETVLPGTIALACADAGVPWGHVSSGCIYTGAA